MRDRRIGVSLTDQGSRGRRCDRGDRGSSSITSTTSTTSTTFLNDLRLRWNDKHRAPRRTHQRRGNRADHRAAKGTEAARAGGDQLNALLIGKGQQLLRGVAAQNDAADLQPG